MSVGAAETAIRGAGGLLAYITLGAILYGIWRGTRRPAGRATGRTAAWLRSAWFYLVLSVLFFGVCYLGWIPLPLTVAQPIRVWMLATGSLLYFPGMFFALWGRLALGENYFVSTGFGAQLFSGHKLVTQGPFAVVRHPMYSGIIISALGSLLIYFTWTSLLFVIFSPVLIVRARREEIALAAEFGNQWLAYCRRVPGFVWQLRPRPGMDRAKGV